MPNYRKYSLPSTPVFITICTQGRKPWLIRNSECILNSMKNVKVHYAFRHIAHVIMSDHMHWLFEPECNSFSIIVAAFKREVTWKLKSLSVNEKWQKRFYDHVVRDENDLKKHLDYIHYNPVKHGLVDDAFEYEFSSIHKREKRGVYSRGWGLVEPEEIIEMNLE